MFICRYLASGDQALSIALAYRIGESTCLAIVKETCKVLSEIMMPVYLPFPDESLWKKIMEEFLENWNMPHCLGAVDGKHVVIQAPPNSGSQYFNYKKTFSIVLMAVCDAHYKFTLVDIGAYGSNNDSKVFYESDFGKAFMDAKLNIPKGTAPLPGTNIQMPCFFVGDDAFGLSKHQMKPYSGKHLSPLQKIFNYRLSRARRTIENVFGILVSRWRILRKPICLYPSSVDDIVKATVCLHNFLMVENEKKSPTKRLYCPPSYIDTERDDGTIEAGDWRLDSRNSLIPIPSARAHNASREAYHQRNVLASYFLTEHGKVDWQESYISRGLNMSLSLYNNK